MDLFAYYNLLRDSLRAHLEPVIVLHLLLLLLLAVGSLPAIRDALRRTSRAQGLVILGLMVSAFAIRAFWIPALSRHIYDGHEADYFDVWRGASGGLAVGYRASELVRFLYALVGPFFGGSGRALVLLNLLLSLVTIPLTWIWLRELTGSDRAGLYTACFLTIDPIHGFWASSAYNIQLPFILCLMSLAMLELAFRRGSAITLAFSLILWATAVAARGEALLLAVPLGWRLLLERRLIKALHHKWWALLGPIPFLAWPLLSGGQANLGRNPTRYMWEMFWQQIGMLDYFRPYDQWLLMGGLLLISAYLSKTAPRLWSVLAMAWMIVLSHHFAYSLFDDYDFRHTLLPRLAFGLILGTFLAALPKKGYWARAANMLILLIFSVFLLRSTQDVAARYYATPEMFFQAKEAFQDAPYIRPENYRHCIFIAENGYYWQFPHASHFELYSSRERKKLEKKSKGCLLFVYDLENYQASSRSIDGRALKVRRLFELELLGKRIDRQGENYALIYSVETK